MIRRVATLALLSALLLTSLAPAAAIAETALPFPDTMAAVGDSITQAASTGGTLGADAPQNSWSTGTNSTVNSHYLRLLGLGAPISGQNHNKSVSGAKAAGLNAQMQTVMPLQPDYLTVLIGGNDLCTDTVAQMTSVATFRAQLETAMATLTAGSPGTRVYVVSIPNVYQLWNLFKGDFWARFIWDLANICQSLLVNPTSTAAADVQRRETVRLRNIDYNTQLAQVCALYPLTCRFDGNAVFNTTFTTGDVSGDYFHPSIAGQKMLASVTWAAGYTWAPPPPPNQAPTASFTSSCTYLACSFDATGSTDADGSVVGYAWTFGAEGPGTGLTTSHTFSAAGTYNVSLTVTDDDGATGSVTQSVAVSAPLGTIRIESLGGSSGVRKGGWTATVNVMVSDTGGRDVTGAVVSGSWTTGASGGCTVDGQGLCSFTLNVNRKVATVTWTVATITHSTLIYDADKNLATSVTISRP